MAERHILGGRAFVPIGESTVEHDFTFMGLIRAAGLDRVAIREGESAQDFALRLLQEAIASGKVLEMLGCLLIPEGTAPEHWTPRLGAETAAFFGGLTAAADKLTIQALVLSLLIDFFEQGLSSLETSRTSSEAAQPHDSDPSPRTAGATGAT